MWPEKREQFIHSDPVQDLGVEPCVVYYWSSGSPGQTHPQYQSPGFCPTCLCFQGFVALSVPSDSMLVSSSLLVLLPSQDLNVSSRPLPHWLTLLPHYILYRLQHLKSWSSISFIWIVNLVMTETFSFYFCCGVECGHT